MFVASAKSGFVKETAGSLDDFRDVPTIFERTSKVGEFWLRMSHPISLAPPVLQASSMC